MTPGPDIADRPAPLTRARDAAPDEAVWSIGWAVGLVASAALLLAGGGASAASALALGFAAAPGLIGGLWRPRMEDRFALLALWALGVVLAVCVTGGLAGPLAALCLVPAFACLVIGGSWRAGAGLCLAVVAFCALAGALRLNPEAPVEPVRSAVALIALLAACAAAAGALLTVRRQAAARREAEQELSGLQALLGDLPDLALAMDAGGRTEMVFGQPLAGLDLEALHISLTSVAIPADRSKLEAAMGRAATQGHAQARFTPLSSPDRNIAVALQRTALGGLVAILREAPPPAIVSPDQTQRLAAAEAARQAAEQARDAAEAAAASRARFLANMSHELRTPLNAIMGFSDMMRARMFGPLTPKYGEYAELIHESGGHLLDLINDVLDMSKIEAQRYTLSREVFDVREAVNAALRLVRLQADEAGVRLRAVLPPDPLAVDADQRAIKQIVLNLISNALKFTPKDGTVILTAKAVGGELELVVADTGAGIAAEDLKRLGRPFEQAGEAGDRARGTGLGLSLVAAFAKLHGGSLTLESRLGEGTAATVRMPVLAAAAPPFETPVEAPSIEPPSPAVEPAAVEPHAADPLPEIRHVPAASSFAPPVEGGSTSAPDPRAPTADLNAFEARTAEHQGLRQTVIDLFAHRPTAKGPNR